MNIKIGVVSLLTIARREVLRIFRIWLQTLLPPAITMTLYFIIFGKIIGSQIQGINGFTYMEFIIPGIIMMAVIINSYSNVVASFFGAKFLRSIEEILVSSTPCTVIIVGYVIGGVTRGLVIGIVITIVSMFFSDLHIHNLGIVFLFIILTSAVFSLAGMINAIFAEKFDDIAIFPTFVLTPLTYLGGVFYSISLLPDFWQTVSRFNPVLYMVSGFRYGFLGVSDISVSFGLGMLVVFMLVLFFINLYLIRKGIGLKT